MNKQTGADRPARKLKSIAVAAIVLILGLAGAVYAQETGDHWYGMGSDNVLGMMPPGGMKPYGSGKRVQIPPCAARPDITLVQPGAKGRTVTYVATKTACIYTISREGKAWLTVTYDTTHKTYRLTDPNGTGALLLELGIDPGKFNPWVTTKKNRD